MICTLCPRACNVNRKFEVGFCGANDNIYVSKAYLHQWEEPCISGENGSGTIFFSPCNLKCVFCQNFDISHQRKGVSIDTDRLCEIMLELQKKGAHNINLVTPTPYIDKIAHAIRLIKPELKIPVVYNCSGYESVETLTKIQDVIDIFIPDLKFKDDNLCEKYLKARDYYSVAISAIERMIKLTGTPSFQGNIMRNGVIIRHLVMPSHYRDSIEILDDLHKKFGTGAFLLSLMSQYLPCGNAKNFPKINRKLTQFEYNKVLDHASDLGFNGFSQDKNSATSDFIPKFDNEGVLKNV